MNIDQLLVAVCAAAFVGAGALVWSGFRAQPTHIAVKRRSSSMPILAAVLAGLVVLALSGWVIPTIVVGALVGWAAHRWQQHSRGDDLGAARVEALASWVENVRDVMQAAGQPVGAIGATTETAPEAIRPHVRALYARLSAGQPAEVVFRRFADEMDDPLADLVAVGLLIAVSRGAQTEQVLSSLAQQARHLADRRRIVEAERAPMRHQVTMVSLVMCALLAGVFIFARSSYLNAYDSAEGQIVLALILVAYAALVIRVLALSRFPKPSRFLTLRAES